MVKILISLAIFLVTFYVQQIHDYHLLFVVLLRHKVVKVDVTFMNKTNIIDSNDEIALNIEDFVYNFNDLLSEIVLSKVKELQVIVYYLCVWVLYDVRELLNLLIFICLYLLPLAFNLGDGHVWLNQKIIYRLRVVHLTTLKTKELFNHLILFMLFYVIQALKRCIDPFKWPIIWFSVVLGFTVRLWPCVHILCFQEAIHVLN